MLRSILVDDEPLALESLQTDLQAHCADVVQVLDLCDSPLQGLRSIRKHQPDLVFLDIGMEGYETDGFEMLEILGDISFSVIFVTSHSEHALKAFKVSATDFLLKPFTPQELRQAVKKVQQQRQQPGDSKLWELVEQLRLPSPSNREKISFPIAEGLIYLAPETILYCAADGAFTHIFPQGEHSFLTTKGLKTVEELLPASDFFRIHYSYLINRQYLKKFLAKGNGNPQVVMQDGTELPVSRHRKKAFLAWMENRTE